MKKFDEDQKKVDMDQNNKNSFYRKPYLTATCSLDEKPREEGDVISLAFNV